MALFETAYKRTAKIEGGYSDRAADRGGETYKGISRRANPGWNGWFLIDARKASPDFPKNLEDYQALQDCIPEFYRAEYWNRINGDLMNSQEIANELYDTAVNMGWITAGLFLQRSLNILNKKEGTYPNVPTDGIIGPKTLFILNDHKKPAAVLKTLNGFQFCYYKDIAEHDETQELNFYSWLERT